MTFHYSRITTTKNPSTYSSSTAEKKKRVAKDRAHPRKIAQKAPPPPPRKARQTGRKALGARGASTQLRPPPREIHSSRSSIIVVKKPRRRNFSRAEIRTLHMSRAMRSSLPSARARAPLALYAPLVRDAHAAVCHVFSLSLGFMYAEMRRLRGGRADSRGRREGCEFPAAFSSARDFRDWLGARGAIAAARSLRNITAGRDFGECDAGARPRADHKLGARDVEIIKFVKPVVLRGLGRAVTRAPTDKATSRGGYGWLVSLGEILRGFFFWEIRSCVRCCRLCCVVLEGMRFLTVMFRVSGVGG